MVCANNSNNACLQAPRPSASLAAYAAAAHSPRASPSPAPPAKLASNGAPKPALPPRSALSFRKIGDHVVRPGSKLCFEWAEVEGREGSSDEHWVGTMTFVLHLKPIILDSSSLSEAGVHH